MLVGALEALRFIRTETPKPGPKTRSRTTSFPLVVKLSVAAKQGDRVKRVLSIYNTTNCVVVFA